ncbi:hypothetical protein [Geitlerinema sp. PCC 7407]|uniref:hypothetical protein n=1 Tax=Geitlerinema sp. PCC 7407 TaxID=1173025 RepID=UPI00029FD29E|nr:hypothetical protein [Geitlerinema sp. PCC 7407]AFY67027.1 hypothetical protein GEI7407_2552 [Geitlerinema sp. PCC 7407]
MPAPFPDPYLHFKAVEPDLRLQAWRLHRITVGLRWLWVGILWMTIAPASLWRLRGEFALWREYFTWSAVRYGLVYHPVATLGIAFCIGMLLSVLVWQSRNILFDLPRVEQRRLEKQVRKIRHQGPVHPLWRWVWSPYDPQLK